MNASQKFFSRTKSIPAADLCVVVKPEPREGNVIELLDPAKLIAYWTKEDLYPWAPTMTEKMRRTDLSFFVDAYRLHRLVEGINEGASLPAIHVRRSEGTKDGLTFPDGRHRIVLFEAMGLSSIPAEIPESMAEYVVGVAGAEHQDPRLTILKVGRRAAPRR